MFKTVPIQNCCRMVPSETYLNPFSVLLGGNYCCHIMQFWVCLSGYQYMALGVNKKFSKTCLTDQLLSLIQEIDDLTIGTKNKIKQGKEVS